MGWAAAPMRSFGGLQLGHRLERIDFMAAREGEERFLRRGAVREIGFENARDGARRLVGDDVAIKLAAERRVRAEAAADKDVITLERIVVFVDLDLAGEQPDLGRMPKDVESIVQRPEPPPPEPDLPAAPVLSCQPPRHLPLDCVARRWASEAEICWEAGTARCGC